MLIPMPELTDRWDVRPEVVIHAGAHLVQEREWYRDAGATDVLWIEANPPIAERARAILADWPGHRLEQACLSASSGAQVTFHVTEANDGTQSNEGMSSSVLELGTHRTAHPEVVVVDEIELTTTTLDDLVATYHADLLLSDRLLFALDLQGYEGPVLLGAYTVLDVARWVYLEVNMDPLYEGAMLFPEVEQMLMQHGFQFEAVKLAGCQRRNCSDGGNRWVGWGDAFASRAHTPTLYRDRHPECRDWYR